ncbi:MAG: HAD family phosphatase [Actinomycetota bacterium]
MTTEPTSQGSDAAAPLDPPDHPELVVFDCDGVLVDSEVLVVDVEARMLTEAGFPITADEIADHFIGLSYGSMMAELARRHGRAVPDDLSERIQQAAIDRFPDHLRPVPGMPALLAGSERPRCVASSSDLDRIALSLQLTGLDVHFAADRVFSAQMVERGKPAPDLFLLAAETLDVETAACLVVEDSTAGVVAARAAGMDVVGLVAGGHARPNLGDRLTEAGARRVFTTVEELAGHLDSGTGSGSPHLDGP